MHLVLHMLLWHSDFELLKKSLGSLYFIFTELSNQEIADQRCFQCRLNIGCHLSISAQIACSSTQSEFSVHCEFHLIHPFSHRLSKWPLYAWTLPFVWLLRDFSLPALTKLLLLCAFSAKLLWRSTDQKKHICIMVNIQTLALLEQVVLFFL